MDSQEDTDNKSLQVINCTVRFPYFSLLMVLVVSFLVSATLLWHKDKIEKEYNALFEFSNDITTQLAQVALADEILSMSARMAATTGDSVWAERYNNAVPTMDKALARISEIAPSDLLATLDEETSASNDALIALEDEALNLAAAGNTTQAQAILNSTEYQAAKDQLTAGAIKFEEGILAITKEEKRVLEDEIQTSFWVSVVGILIVLGAWISLFTTLKRWERGLKEAEIENLATEKRRIEEEKAAQEARKERDMRASEERRQTLHSLAQQLEDAVGSVVASAIDASDEMNMSANSMVEISSQTSSQASGVASSAQAASQNVETVASATEELTSSISEISRQVNQASGIAQKAVVDAGTTNDQIEGLAVAAQKIGEVVSLITTIADQTNLLALNATIEAARAGEAGKGFAVVASEVKNLANQTAKATEEIGGQISSIQDATENSVIAVQNIAKTIGEIEKISSTIAVAVEEQGSATQEIARNVEEASAGTQNVTREIAVVSQSAEKTGDASQSIVTGTSNLGGEVKKLEQQISTFLHEIRTGT